MWKLTKNKSPVGQQELKVKSILREMAEYSFATYAAEFESSFKKLIKEVPRTNNYSADLMYKVKHLSQKSVEIWKVNVYGDFKYKMFTLDYVGQ